MPSLLLALPLALAAAPQETPPVEIIAHRGESADAPENTLAAFNLAWDRGVSSIELDVHLTADDRLVCVHDADAERTTGTALAIKDATLDQLRALDAGRWKGPRWAGEPMPTLEEALATIPDGARCFIEVKVGPEAVPALARAVRASGKSPDQLAVISFNAETIAEAKRTLPELPAYYLSSFRRDDQSGLWVPTASELIAQARAIGADGLDLAVKGPIDAEFVRRVRDAGLELYVWTVDDLDDARRLAGLGVDGITTNRAAWLRDQLAASGVVD